MTPLSAISRKKTTDSSNLTITLKYRNQKRQLPAQAGEDTHDTFFGD
jgi:hypothetical protein